MNTKLSYVEFLQLLNDPTSRLHKLYDIKYNNRKINIDWYFFSPITGVDDSKLPSLTLVNWVRKWPELCQYFTFKFIPINNTDVPFVYGDATLITFETYEFKRVSLTSSELYTLFGCVSVIKAHGLHSLVDEWLVDICCEHTTVNDIINKLLTLNLEDIPGDTIYTVEEFYE
jgi:hypothetical protein